MSTVTAVKITMPLCDDCTCPPSVTWVPTFPRRRGLSGVVTPAAVSVIG